jgi:thiamine-phosphate pyrophosphorylase
MRKMFDLSAYLVLDPDLCAAIGMVETARLAALGGVTAVQLRYKTATTEQRIVLGQKIQRVLPTGVAFVMNDDIDAAVALTADALHIGQSDGGAAAARNRIGSQMLLGLSVETPEKASSVDQTVVDYVGVGPVFATPTKQDHKTPLGWDGLMRVIACAPVPAVAIGGVKTQHVPDAIAAGAAGVAVVSAICGQPDPQAATATLVHQIKEARA